MRNGWPLSFLHTCSVDYLIYMDKAWNALDWTKHTENTKLFCE